MHFGQDTEGGPNRFDDLLHDVFVGCRFSCKFVAKIHCGVDFWKMSVNTSPVFYPLWLSVLLRIGVLVALPLVKIINFGKLGNVF